MNTALRPPPRTISEVPVYTGGPPDPEVCDRYCSAEDWRIYDWHGNHWSPIAAWDWRLGVHQLPEHAFGLTL